MLEKVKMRELKNSTRILRLKAEKPLWMELEASISKSTQLLITRSSLQPDRGRGCLDQRMKISNKIKIKILRIKARVCKLKSKWQKIQFSMYGYQETTSQVLRKLKELTHVRHLFMVQPRWDQAACKLSKKEEVLNLLGPKGEAHRLTIQVGTQGQGATESRAVLDLKDIS